MTDQQRRLPAPDSTPDAPALNVYGQTKEGAGVHLAGNYAGLRALEEHIHKALAHDYPVFTGPERFVNLNNGRPYLLSIESDRKGPGHPSWLNNPDPYDVPHAYDNQEGHEYKRLYKRMKYAERHAEGRDSRAREMERENVRLKLALLFTQDHYPNIGDEAIRRADERLKEWEGTTVEMMDLADEQLKAEGWS